MQKSGIKEHVSDTVMNKLAYAHMGLPYEHTRQGNIGFHDLDYSSFVQGELGIILEPSMHALPREAQGRLQLLLKISNIFCTYEWSAVKDFYASVLHKLERGLISWGALNLHTMELETLSLLVDQSIARLGIFDPTWPMVTYQQPHPNQPLLT